MKLTKICKFCNQEFTIPYKSWGDRKYCNQSCVLKDRWANLDYRKRQSNLHKGLNAGDKNPSKRPEVRLKISQALKGRVFTPETIIKMSKGQKRRFAIGDRSSYPQWKGGITKENKLARTCIEFKEWQQKVFKRDNWTCKMCGYQGRKIEAHHIKSFANYIDLRYVINNGITLCQKCHSKIDKYRASTIREMKLAYSYS